MFREMNVIAAVAYAAEQAHADQGPHLTLSWAEIEDGARSEHIQRVMAIMRGEDTDANDVFQATVKAILAGPNGDSNGELALEEIAKLGDYMLNANLLTVEEAQQGGSIVGHALQLLEQLATIKSMFVPFETASEEEAAAAANDQADELATESEPTIQ